MTFRRVWEKHVQPRVEANRAHEAYYLCYDDNDPDVIWVFQLSRDKESLEAFSPARGYPVYLREVAQFVAAEPQVTAAAPVWIKAA